MTPDYTPVQWTPAERAAFEAKRRSRNIALGSVLVALALLFYGITVVRMAPGIKDAGDKAAAGAAAAAASRPAPARMPAP
jgi:hypothetical protein